MAILVQFEISGTVFDLSFLLMRPPEELREPQNSWELCYVISVKKPFVRLGGMDPNLIRRAIEFERRRELVKWADKYFSQLVVPFNRSEWHLRG